MQWSKKGFGLGYADGPDGELSHHLWCDPGDGTGSGLYRVMWMSYQDHAQFLELMALLGSLGDQVRLVRILEPPAIQLQDLVAQPLRQHAVTRRGKYESIARALAFWQVRMLDVPGCVAATQLPGEPLQFNLQLADPIEPYLEAASGWRGTGGDYVVRLGPESAARRGRRPELLAHLDALLGALPAPRPDWEY